MKYLQYVPTHEFPIDRKSAGRNIHIPLVDSNGSMWFGKLCCPLSNETPEVVCQREVAFSHLVRLVGAPAIEVEFVSNISNMSDLLDALEAYRARSGSVTGLPWEDKAKWAHYLKTLVTAPPKILVASRYVPNNIRFRDLSESNSHTKIINLRELLVGCLVHFWIGNGDGNVDLNIIIDKDYRAFTIDYGYYDPTCPFPSFDVNLLKNFLPQQLKDTLSFYPDRNNIIEEAINNIESISSIAITETLSIAWVGTDITRLLDALERRQSTFRNTMNHINHYLL